MPLTPSWKQSGVACASTGVTAWLCYLRPDVSHPPLLDHRSQRHLHG